MCCVCGTSYVNVLGLLSHMSRGGEVLSSCGVYISVWVQCVQCNAGNAASPACERKYICVYASGSTRISMLVGVHVCACEWRYICMHVSVSACVYM